MSAERILVYAVVGISTAGSVIRFALFEFDEVLSAWRKVWTTYTSRESSNSRNLVL